MWSLIAAIDVLLFFKHNGVLEVPFVDGSSIAIPVVDALLHNKQEMMFYQLFLEARAVLQDAAGDPDLVRIIKTVDLGCRLLENVFQVLRVTQIDDRKWLMQFERQPPQFLGISPEQ